VTCPFCEEKPVDRNGSLVYVRVVPEAFYPATVGHTLIIPRRHTANWFTMSVAEQLDTLQELETQQSLMLAEDSTIEGFNIGMNVGEVAGQTVFHAHTHLIPRRPGDVTDPRYGVIRHLMLELYPELKEES
jgi:ATP adenylyltransferase